LEEFCRFLNTNKLLFQLLVIEGSKTVVVVVLPDSFWGMGWGGTPRRPNSRVTPQALDQR